MFAVTTILTSGGLNVTTMRWDLIGTPSDLTASTGLNNHWEMINQTSLNQTSDISCMVEFNTILKPLKSGIVSTDKLFLVLSANFVHACHTNGGLKNRVSEVKKRN